MQTTSDARPAPHRPTRRGPRWWWIVLVQACGTWAGAVLAFVAFVSLPEYGFFGVPNDDGTRAMGALAAVGSLVCVLSGPILVGLVRRDRTWLRGVAWVVGGLALLLLPVLTG